MFDQDDHPSVPTWLPPERGAQGRSRMPPAAPAKPARLRQPRAQRYADLPETPIPPRQKLLTIGGESPFRHDAAKVGNRRTGAIRQAIRAEWTQWTFHPVGHSASQHRDRPEADRERPANSTYWSSSTSSSNSTT